MGSHVARGSAAGWANGARAPLVPIGGQGTIGGHNPFQISWGPLSLGALGNIESNKSLSAFGVSLHSPLTPELRDSSRKQATSDLP